MAFAITSYSGFKLHIAGHFSTHEVWHNWAVFHTLVSLAFVVLEVLHIQTHWGWYKGLITKGIGKKSKVTLCLSIIYLITSLTGIILLGVCDCQSDIGMWHYRLAIILTIIGLGYFIKRFPIIRKTISIMHRIRVLLFVLVPWIMCVAVALTSLGCRSMYVSSNLGAKMDSIGKAVPQAHDFRYYMLDGKRYVDCEVRYRSLDISVIGYQFPHLYTLDGYGELPGYMKTPPPTRYVLALNDNEVIATEHFDYARAIRIDRPEAKGHDVTEQYLTQYRLLSADLAELMILDNPVDFVPVVRTAGNYARTPLVALVSYGVDVPVTLACNVGGYTMFGAAMLIFGATEWLVECLR